MLPGLLLRFSQDHSPRSLPCHYHSGLPHSMNCDDEFISPQIFVIDPSFIASGIRAFMVLSTFSLVTVWRYLS